MISFFDKKPLEAALVQTPIRRSVNSIAWSHVGCTFGSGLAALFPCCCLAGMFADAGGNAPGPKGFLGFVAVLVMLVAQATPLLIGLSQSFSQLRRNVIMEDAAACTRAATTIFIRFAAVAAVVIPVVLIIAFGLEGCIAGLFLGALIAMDCAVFWLLTRYSFNKMAVPKAHGFP